MSDRELYGDGSGHSAINFKAMKSHMRQGIGSRLI